MYLIENRICHLASRKLTDDDDPSGPGGAVARLPIPLIRKDPPNFYPAVYNEAPLLQAA